MNPADIQTLMSDFLFLRYFNPHIANPEPLGIVPESMINQKVRYNLMQVSAVLSVVGGGGKRKLRHN